MKRMVLCFDGTWNKPADENLAAEEQVETNVCRFYRSVKEAGADGHQQLKWYDEGVGTKWYDRFIGGAIGVGLEKNILDGYKFSPSSTKTGMKFMSSVSAAALIRREVSSDCFEMRGCDLSVVQVISDWRSWVRLAILI